VLERGDCGVMGNYGFHHNHRVEPALRVMFFYVLLQLKGTPKHTYLYIVLDYMICYIHYIFTLLYKYTSILTRFAAL